MTTGNFILAYLCIGCIKGIVEFFIAQRAFRNHPHAAAVSWPGMFLSCILKNAVAWPVFVFWLALLGLFKMLILFRRPGGVDEKVQAHTVQPARSARRLAETETLDRTSPLARIPRNRKGNQAQSLKSTIIPDEKLRHSTFTLAAA